MNRLFKTGHEIVRYEAPECTLLPMVIQNVICASPISGGTEDPDFDENDLFS